MAGWEEGLSAWDQTSYFVAGLGLVYLISVIPWPWDWLARLPPGWANSESDDVGIDLGAMSLDAFGGDGTSDVGDAGGHAGGHDGGGGHGGE